MFIAVIVGLILLFLSIKVVGFVAKGGTMALPARNATLLFYQIQRVYPKMKEGTARYMALRLNSAAAKDQISDSAILSLVKEHEHEDWQKLCLAYTWLWHQVVGGVSIQSIPMEKHMEMEAKIKQQMDIAKREVENGSTEYENELRAIPSGAIMSVAMKTLDL